MRGHAQLNCLNRLVSFFKLKKLDITDSASFYLSTFPPEFSGSSLHLQVTQSFHSFVNKCSPDNQSAAMRSRSNSGVRLDMYYRIVCQSILKYQVTFSLPLRFGVVF